MDNDQYSQQQPGTPIYQESQGKNAKWLWILIALIIVGVIAFAVVRGIGPFSALNLNFLGGEEEASPTPSSVRFESPSPTPTESTSGATLDRSEPVVRVLNGSGIAGVASTMKDFLEGKGYSVASVGNADNFDYEQTTLRFKSSFTDFESLLENDLSDDYSVVVSDDVIDSDYEADIEVIIGAK
jgi:hypothetical protein